MSMDFVPATDYKTSRPERRRQQKEMMRAMSKGTRRINAPHRGPNRKMRRTGNWGEIDGYTVEYADASYMGGF